MTTSVSLVSLIPDASFSTGQLPPLQWLHADETRQVVAALEAGGTAVRFIGGCVRDTIAHRPVSDIDIATPDPPETVLKLLENAGIKAVPTGLDHGTVTAVSNGRPFEVTTLRRDVETDGRHATVAFTDDWLEDARRRDFTINAMSATPGGDVFDPFDGIADLAHRRVRFIGKAAKRIEEDYLRILRFFRFHGTFGRAPMDRDARIACRAQAENLKTLSGERIRNELLKILVVADPAEIVMRMRGETVLEQILPEAGDINRLRLINWLETRAVNIEHVEPDAIRHLAALLDTDRAGAKIVAERLRLSNAQAERLIGLVAPTEIISNEMGERREMRAIRHLGAQRVRDLALIAWADDLVRLTRLPRPQTDAYIALLERCAGWMPPDFPLDGGDVLALGIIEGPEVGGLLSRVETWWENTGYEADRQDCLNRLMKEAGKKTGGTA